MQIEGTYTLQASPETVWNCLMDQQTVQHALPGLERLTKVDEHTYTFAIHLRHAPLRGIYTGRASVLDANYPSSYHLKVEGEGQPNMSNIFRSECDVRLSTHNENTVVSYQGVLQPGRSSVLVPASLVKATLKVLLQQFFNALTDQLRTEQGDPVYIATLEEMYEMPFMEEQIGEQLLRAYRENPPTLLHRLVRLLGLGRRNPHLEEQWVRRLRQVGIAAILLLLVWAGTRLPRRPPPRS